MITSKEQPKHGIRLKVLSFFYNLVNKILIKYRLSIIYYFYIDAKLLELIRHLRYQEEMLLTFTEAVQLVDCVNSCLKLDGSIAEVGVYRGGSAKLMCNYKGTKELYLFDTFEGLPYLDKESNYFKKGQYSSPFEAVKSSLQNYENIHLFKGLFPASALPVGEKRFCFVHLDVDLYKSTKDCLDFFYNRMTKGGMILSHDYPLIPGVKKAFDEFFADKPECVIKMSGNQALVVKS
jgi:O-methyltransferase